MNAIIKATDLVRHYEVKRGYFGSLATVKALAGVSFSLSPGKTLADCADEHVSARQGQGGGRLHGHGRAENVRPVKRAPSPVGTRA